MTISLIHQAILGDGITIQHTKWLKSHSQLGRQFGDRYIASGKGGEFCFFCMKTTRCAWLLVFKALIIFFFFHITCISTYVKSQVFVGLIIDFHIPCIDIVSSLIFIFHLMRIRHASRLLIKTAICSFSVNIISIQRHFPFLGEFSIVEDVSYPLIIVCMRMDVRG